MRLRHRRIDEGTVVRRCARSHVRTEVGAGDTHALHRDLSFLLERANHLHEGRQQRRLLVERQCPDGLREELRPRPRLRREASAADGQVQQPGPWVSFVRHPANEILRDEC